MSHERPMNGPEEHESAAEKEITIDSLLETLREKTEYIRELEQRVKKLEKDPLMNIANKTVALEKIDQMDAKRSGDIERAAAESEPEYDAVLMLDIDNFKIVNDAFNEGHLGGDRILQEAAAYLKTQFRDSDFIARWGGEEILVFLKSTDVKKFMERPHLSFTTTLDGEQIPITFSGGLTIIKPGESARDAISRADKTLYTAKEDKERPDGTIERGRDKIMLSSDDADLPERKPPQSEPLSSLGNEAQK